MTAPTPRRRTFKFASARPTEPVIIDLEGVSIRCRPGLDGLKMMQFTETVSAASALEDEVATGVITEDEATKKGIAAAKAFIVLLEQVVVDEDWPLFQNTVREQDIPLDGLTEIASWLIEVYSERPTQSSSASAPGSSTNGRTSTAKPSSQA